MKFTAAFLAFLCVAVYAAPASHLTEGTSSTYVIDDNMVDPSKQRNVWISRMQLRTPLAQRLWRPIFDPKSSRLAFKLA